MCVCVGVRERERERERERDSTFLCMYVCVWVFTVEQHLKWIKGDQSFIVTKCSTVSH